jgi:hypothetical protein
MNESSMSKIVVFWIGLASAIAAPPDHDIRNVDFGNHVYPWHPTRGWPHALEWQRISEENHVEIVNRRWKEPDDSGTTSSNSGAPFVGLTLEEIVFGDLTGDSKDEAVVILRYDSGGTQYHHYVYVYRMEADSLKLLAWFRSGDRAANGLYRVVVRDHKLIVDLYDPARQQGDCCSSGFIRRQYRWSGSMFVKTGTIERGTPQSRSRIPVSVFGMPTEQMHP